MEQIGYITVVYHLCLGHTMFYTPPTEMKHQEESINPAFFFQLQETHKAWST